MIIFLRFFLISLPTGYTITSLWLCKNQWRRKYEELDQKSIDYWLRMRAEINLLQDSKKELRAKIIRSVSEKAIIARQEADLIALQVKMKEIEAHNSELKDHVLRLLGEKEQAQDYLAHYKKSYPLPPGFLAQQERVREGKAPRAPDGKILPGKSGIDPSVRPTVLFRIINSGWVDLLPLSKSDQT